MNTASKTVSYAIERHERASGETLCTVTRIVCTPDDTSTDEIARFTVRTDWPGAVRTAVKAARFQRRQGLLG